MNERELRDLRAWAATALGAEVRALDRIGSGASRATFRVRAERPGESLDAVLRVDTGDGPMSGTALDLAREAAVFRALEGSGVPAPGLIAQRDGGGALLIGFAPGSDAFALAPDDAKPAIAESYLRALARLHALDTAPMALPGFDRPASAAGAARPDLALWRGIYQQRAADTDSLVEFALDWLDANAPTGAERVSLCHGDAGPGNFLFEGSRVTALLDWEFAHLGDPLDDLAWIAVRSHLLGGFGDASRNVAAWESATGLRADPARIECYRALVLVRMAIACQAALAHTGSRAMDTAVYAMLLPYLHYLLPQALALAGCRAPELDGFEGDGTRAIEAHALLREHARPLAAVELP